MAKCSIRTPLFEITIEDENASIDDCLKKLMEVETERNQDRAKNCTYADKQYSPGAKILVGDEKIKCLPDGTWL